MTIIYITLGWDCPCTGFLMIQPNGARKPHLCPYKLLTVFDVRDRYPRHYLDEPKINHIPGVLCKVTLICVCHSIGNTQIKI